MRRRIDELLFSSFTRNWEKEVVDHYLDALQASESVTPEYVASLLERIDVKATALVTYVAMMIAGIGICAPLVAKHPYEETVVILQITAFLLVAIGCLRCMSTFGPPTAATSDAKATLRMLEREILIRQELYRVCYRTAIFLTSTAFISMPIMLLWRPTV